MSAQVGRAVQSDRVVNVNSGELWVNLAGSADHDDAVDGVVRTMRRHPLLKSEVVTYSADLVDEVRAGNAEDAPVVVRVYGYDLDVLQQQAQRVSRVLDQVPGVLRPQVPTALEEPTLEVEVDLARARSHGIKPGDVRRTAATYFSGLPVGALYNEQKVFGVVVWGSPSTRATSESLRELLVDTPGGGHVRLGDVAAVRVTPFRTVIEHDATSRSVDVSADIRGRDLGSVLDDVESRIQALPMPYEYHAEVLSDVAHQQSQDLRIAGVALAALLGAYLLLQAAFSSWRLAALVMLALPPALAGGVLTAFGIGGVMSAGALAGFLLVLGMAVHNLVLLIRGYQAIEQRGDESAEPGLVLAATRDRVGPVLLTALATAAAVVVPAVSAGAAGMEVLHPMAVVVLGALLTSTLVTLFVVPALFIRFFPLSGGLRWRRANPPPVSDPTGATTPGATTASDAGTQRRASSPTASGGRRPGRLPATALAVAAMLVTGAGLSACSGAHTASGSSEEAPAAIEEVEEPEIPHLTLEKDVAHRIGIRTDPLRQAPPDGSTGPPRALIPLTAVVYDPEGLTWVFTSPEPLVFIRTRVVLGQFGDGFAVVKSGPSAGAHVVTVGAAELLGIEYRTDGEH